MSKTHAKESEDSRITPIFNFRVNPGSGSRGSLFSPRLLYLFLRVAFAFGLELRLDASFRLEKITPNHCKRLVNRARTAMLWSCVTATGSLMALLYDKAEMPTANQSHRKGFIPLIFIVSFFSSLVSIMHHAFITPALRDLSNFEPSIGYPTCVCWFAILSANTRLLFYNAVLMLSVGVLCLVCRVDSGELISNISIAGLPILVCVLSVRYMILED